MATLTVGTSEKLDTSLVGASMNPVSVYIKRPQSYNQWFPYWWFCKGGSNAKGDMYLSCRRELAEYAIFMRESNKSHPLRRRGPAPGTF